MHSLNVHPTLVQYLKPIYISKDHLRNPGKMVEEK